MHVAIIQTSQLKNRDDISTSTILSSLTSDLGRNDCRPSCETSIIPNPSLTVNSVVKTAENPLLLLLTTRNPAEANTSNITHVCPSDTEICYCYKIPSTEYVYSYIVATIRVYRGV